MPILNDTLEGKELKRISVQHRRALKLLLLTRLLLSRAKWLFRETVCLWILTGRYSVEFLALLPGMLSEKFKNIMTVRFDHYDLVLVHLHVQWAFPALIYTTRKLLETIQLDLYSPTSMNIGCRIGQPYGL
jgi:hypothetical protein